MWLDWINFEQGGQEQSKHWVRSMEKFGQDFHFRPQH